MNYVYKKSRVSAFVPQIAWREHRGLFWTFEGYDFWGLVLRMVHFVTPWAFACVPILIFSVHVAYAGSSENVVNCACLCFHNFFEGVFEFVQLGIFINLFVWVGVWGAAAPQIVIFLAFKKKFQASWIYLHVYG